MKRKIISQGGGGCTIYLPKKWVDGKGLKAGEQINVVEKGTSLVIDSSISEKKEIAIELDEFNERDVRTIITHLYRRGFDKITFQNASAETQSEIKKTASSLLGFELTETGKRSCVVENVSEPSSEKYEVMLRRAFLLVKETQKVILNSFKSGAFSEINELEEQKESQDKAILFCRRMIAKEGIQTKYPVLEWELLTFLMHIEHSYRYLYKYAALHKMKASRKALELLGELEENFTLLYDAYYEKSMSAIHKLNKKEYMEKCYAALEQSRGRESAVLSHIRETFRLVQVGSSPIISIILEEKKL